MREVRQDLSQSERSYIQSRFPFEVQCLDEGIRELEFYGESPQVITFHSEEPFISFLDKWFCKQIIEPIDAQYWTKAANWTEQGLLHMIHRARAYLEPILPWKDHKTPLLCYLPHQTHTYFHQQYNLQSGSWADHFAHNAIRLIPLHYITEIVFVNPNDLVLYFHHRRHPRYYETRFCFVQKPYWDKTALVPNAYKITQFPTLDPDWVHCHHSHMPGDTVDPKYVEEIKIGEILL